MRVPLLILTASLALAGCKNNDVHDNTSNVDENLTAENIVSNDVTAIDAVTGDAANMAADVDVNDTNFESNGSAPPAEPTRTKPLTPKRVRTETPSTAPEPTTQTQTTTNSD